MPCLHGYRSAVEQAGGTVLEVQYCDAQPDRAAAAMEAVMQKYPQGVDALLVTSDDMALAAIKCIWDNNSAAYQKTVICGFDGNQAAVEALDRGELTVDIAQQGYEMGYKAVEAALDALEGKSVESVIDSVPRSSQRTISMLHCRLQGKRSLVRQKREFRLKLSLFILPNSISAKIFSISRDSAFNRIATRFIKTEHVSAQRGQAAQGSPFLYPKREKVSVWELSDDFGTAYGPFLLSAKPWFGYSN
ncbi:MAG: sugar ABC transporter substrate-binding protein [Butyricicoccaceae bacterium]